MIAEPTPILDEGELSAPSVRLLLSRGRLSILVWLATFVVVSIQLWALSTPAGPALFVRAAEITTLALAVAFGMVLAIELAHAPRVKSGPGALEYTARRWAGGLLRARRYALPLGRIRTVRLGRPAKGLAMIRGDSAVLGKDSEPTRVFGEWLIVTQSLATRLGYGGDGWELAFRPGPAAGTLFDPSRGNWSHERAIFSLVWVSISEIITAVLVSRVVPLSRSVLEGALWAGLVVSALALALLVAEGVRTASGAPAA